MNESALEKSGNHHKTKHVQHAIIFSDATRHTHGQQNRIDTQSEQARARPFLTLARLTSLPTPIDSSHHPDCFTASNLRAPPGTLALRLHSHAAALVSTNLVCSDFVPSRRSRVYFLLHGILHRTISHNLPSHHGSSVRCAFQWPGEGAGAS